MRKGQRSPGGIECRTNADLQGSKLCLRRMQIVESVVFIQLVEGVLPRKCGTDFASERSRGRGSIHQS